MAAFVQAQQLYAPTLRSKKIATSGVVTLDTLHVVPHTAVIAGLDTSWYWIDPVKSLLFWKKQPAADSVVIRYRVVPIRLDAVARHMRYDSVVNNFLSQPQVLGKRKASTGLLDFGTGLDYNGSFGRSLSFGNSQDAVFNSQLNLQISGMIGDSIEIAAAITDNNIPIQPDGTTQQLNEFDRILLQFKKKNWEINIGDIDIRQNKNYFLNFYKRLQGLSYQQRNRIGKEGSNEVTVSGAIAKGKFTRNVFQGEEGNQGPYRLRGANNELYFILLANTERVFIDGQLMQRGEDQDYVINYNTAEITFTPRRMITKDKRIQVEFEYADRNYLNAMLYLSDELQLNKKLRLNIAAYNNSDSKNSPINQTLDQQQKQFLAGIGDSIQYAYYPVASIDSFAVDKILYLKRYYTTPAGTIDSFYVYSTNPDSARYNLNFIETGVNKGNYIPLYDNANGKTYQWVAPVNGVPQGNYEPATFLVTPKKQQVVTMGLQYQVNPNTLLHTDVAFSNYDVNTFSGKDKGNNKGYAAKFSLQKTNPIHAFGKKLQLNTMVGYEWVDEKFKPLERLRSVEFARDWGLNILPETATEHLPKASFELKDDKNNALLYTADGYLRSDDFKGVRQVLQYQHNINGWQLKAVTSLVNNSTLNDKGFFLRPTIDISRSFPKLRNFSAGITYALEHNEQRNSATDSLTPLSFAFETITAYIKNDQQQRNRFTLSYFTRTDKVPFQKSLLQTDRSHNYSLSTELLQSSKHQLRTNITYRQLQIKNAALTTLTPDNSLLGRVEYLINEWNGFITGLTLYELGTGQEQRRDFSYIEVQAGRGEYAWNDYNNDGIPQINEFELALFPDQAKYIRVFTPTNQFVKANYTQFNYSVNISPRALSNKIKNKHWRNILTRFSIQSALQTAKKVRAKGSPEFDPFKGNIADTALISLTNTISNTVSFNRFSSVWGLDVSNVRNNSKALLTYGFESRELVDWQLKGRVNVKGGFTLECIQKLGSNTLLTPRFDNRNYNLDIRSTEPRLTYTYGTQYRVQASYRSLSKTNAAAYGGEKTTQNGYTLESKYNAVNNTSLLGKLTYTNITYTGVLNSTVSYIMLDGLLPGKNYQWTIELTKRLGNNLELSLNYEGRKPAETRTIHLGRASLRALL